MYENNYPSDNTYTSGNTYHYEQSTAPKPNKPKKEGTGTGRKIDFCSVSLQDWALRR